MREGDVCDKIKSIDVVKEMRERKKIKIKNPLTLSSLEMLIRAIRKIKYSLIFVAG